MLYGDALQEIVNTLRTADIKATSEMSQIYLPGALVVPGTLTFDHLDGDTYSAQIDVYLLTANKGTVQSLNDLQELLVKFRSVFNAIEAEPISLSVSKGGPDPVPGLLITLQATITKD